MIYIDRKHQRIYRAWEKFVNNAEIEPYVIRPMVANSWHRSWKMKVDHSSSLSNLCLLNDQQIKKRLQRRRKLIGAAIPFMNHLYNFVKGSDTLICLADDNGIILDVLSEPVIDYRTKHLDHHIGSDWSENIVGTNAIGTALFEKKPIQVNGTEHYSKILHSFTGSAAPIFNPERELLGVLYMIDLSVNVHPHTLGMVVAAVKAIENELTSQMKSAELLVAYNKITTAMEAMSDGLIVIEATGMITYLNIEGSKILRVDRNECLNMHFYDIFGKETPLVEVFQTGLEFMDKEFFIETSTGTTNFTLTVKAIRDEGENLTEIIGIFRQMSKVHTLVNKMVGAQANMVFSDIIGNDQELQAVIARAKRVARSGSTVLIQGESGTGKEIFAQAIHNFSGRRDGPFIVVNCAAMPRELVESELFGYEDGAFTGAKRGGRPGKFELANGGTIFLDEIGDMPLDIQTTLLRVLQERQVTRIGGQKYIPINTRVVAATNKNLVEEVTKGKFRLDLYYRLNVVNLQIPSLASRLMDIEPLTKYFVDKLSKRLGQKTPKVSAEFLHCLENYEWPGNIRELENVIEQALHMLESDTLLSRQLPNRIVKSKSINGSQKLKTTEATSINEVLDSVDWNVTKAASILGIARNTLYRKIKHYKLAKT